MTLTNSTVSGNSTAGDYARGGGIYGGRDGAVTLTNSTVSGNSTAGDWRPGRRRHFCWRLAMVTLDQQPRRGQCGAQPPASDEVSGGAVSNTASLIGGDAATIFAMTEEVLIGDTPTGVQGGVLADNGGPTETIALLDNRGNPALDTADPALAPATDQRGVARPQGAGPDIGAFEIDRGEVPPERDTGTYVTTLADNHTGDGELTLREALTYAATTPEADVITFAPSLAGGAITLEAQLFVDSDVTIDGDLNDDGAPDITLDANADGDGDATTALGESGPDFQARRVMDITEDRTVTLEGLILTGGATTAEGEEGGGIRAGEGSNLTLTNSTVSGNSTAGRAAGGGGVFGQGDVTLLNSTVSGNSTAGSRASGGGISGDSVTLTNSTVSGNSTAGDDVDGGGIAGGAVTLTNSTVSHNSTAGSSASGGGISGGDVTLINSTVSHNSTAGDDALGGGIYGRGDVTLTNSTVSANSAAGEDAEGGIHGRGDVTLANTIVAGNVAADGPDDVYAKTFIDTASLIGGDASTIFAMTDEVLADSDGDGIGDAPTGVVGGVLADNGGPTQTIALLDDASNPALDTADPAFAPATDQRGVARPQGAGPDIGAFELVPTPGARLAIDKVVTGVDTAGDGILNAVGDVIDYELAVSNPGSVTLTNVTLTDPLTGTNTNLGTLAPFTSQTVATAYTLTQADLDTHGTAEPDDVAPGQIDNSATADSDETSPVSDSASVQIPDRGTLVTSLADNTTGADGVLTLREALAYAATTPEADTITFDAGLAGGVITLADQLLVDSDLTIDGDIDNDGIVDITLDANADGDGDATTALGESGPDFQARRVMDITEDRTVSLEGLIITGGATTAEGEEGGGIRAGSGSDLTLVGSTVSDNSTAGRAAHGGGISGGTVTLTNSTVSDNGTAGEGARGGGISGGTVTLTNSTVSGNSTAGQYFQTCDGDECDAFHPAHGGGISGGTVTLTNSTVSDNSTAGYEANGGGIFSRGDVTLTNSTVSGNSTARQGAPGGGIRGDVTLINSLVVGNVALNAGADEVAGSVSNTASLIGGDATQVFADTADVLADSDEDGVGDTPTGVQGGVLADNGGPTETIALLDNRGNPALDTADPVFAPATDQRGVARPQGAGPDIGAFELVPTPGAGLAIDKVVTGVDTAGDGVLNAVGDVIDYELAVSNTGTVTLTNVTLTDPLTGTNTNLGTLAPFTSQTVTTAYTLTQDDLNSNGTAEPDDVAPGQIDNTAAADSDETSPVSDSASVQIRDRGTLVTSLADNTMGTDGVLTLREALAYAATTPGADTITFDAGLAGGVITLADQLLVDSDVTIDGDLNDDGAPDITLDANADGDGDATTALGQAGPDFQARRVMDITDERIVTLEGLILTGGATTANGEVGGGIRGGEGSNLTLTNSTVSGNSTAGRSADGGGISGGAVTLTNSTVSDNSTGGRRRGRRRHFWRLM